MYSTDNVPPAVRLRRITAILALGVTRLRKGDARSPAISTASENSSTRIENGVALPAESRIHSPRLVRTRRNGKEAKKEAKHAKIIGQE